MNGMGWSTENKSTKFEGLLKLLRKERLSQKQLLTRGYSLGMIRKARKIINREKVEE